MARDVIANILHRNTIAAIVGARTFERGERVLAEGRVLAAEHARGQLKGTVRPQESGRAAYAARIWIREEGVAYECTCPIGATGSFCKHAVAIALFHVERERKTLEARIGALRDRLLSMPHAALVESLIEQGRADPQILFALASLAVRTLDT